MRRVRACALFLSTAAAMLLAVPAASTAEPVKQPTAIGTGGAAATVDVARHATPRSRRCATAATPSTPPSWLRRCSASPSRSRAASAAAASCSSARATATVTTIDHRETAPAAMRPDSFFENGAPLPFNAARYSGLSAGVPGTVRRLGRGPAAATGRCRSRRRCSRPSRSRATASSSTRPSSTRRRGTSTSSTTSPRRAALYLDPDGTPRDVGTVLRNPDLARAYERIAHLGAKGFYRGAIADAMVEAVQHPPVAPDAEPRLAPRADDDARRQGVHGARARADARSATAASTSTAWARRRAAARPIGEALNILEGFDLDRRRPDAGAAPLPRGVALLVRRPERVPRRPRLLRRAARRPALGRVRGRAPGADRSAARGDAARCRRAIRTRTTTRRCSPRRRRTQTRDDDAPDRLRPLGQRRLVHVHDRVDRRQRDRRARLGLPAQQRADRLQLRLADASRTASRAASGRAAR